VEAHGVRRHDSSRRRRLGHSADLRNGRPRLHAPSADRFTYRMGLRVIAQCPYLISELDFLRGGASSGHIRRRTPLVVDTVSGLPDANSDHAEPMQNGRRSGSLTQAIPSFE
jgi:hypothetical protein